MYKILLKNNPIENTHTHSIIRIDDNLELHLVKVTGVNLIIDGKEKFDKIQTGGHFIPSYNPHEYHCDVRIDEKLDDNTEEYIFHRVIYHKKLEDNNDSFNYVYLDTKSKNEFYNSLIEFGGKPNKHAKLDYIEITVFDNDEEYKNFKEAA